MQLLQSQQSTKPYPTSISVIINDVYSLLSSPDCNCIEAKFNSKTSLFFVFSMFSICLYLFNPLCVVSLLCFSTFPVHNLSLSLLYFHLSPSCNKNSLHKLPVQLNVGIHHIIQEQLNSTTNMLY